MPLKPTPTVHGRFVGRFVVGIVWIVKTSSEIHKTSHVRAGECCTNPPAQDI